MLYCKQTPCCKHAQLRGMMQEKLVLHISSVYRHSAKW